MESTSVKQLLNIFRTAALALGCVNYVEGESVEVSPGGDAPPPIFWMEFPLSGSGALTPAGRGLRTNRWSFTIYGRPIKEDKEDRRNTISEMDAIAEGVITWLTENPAAKTYISMKDYNILSVHGNDDELAGVRVEVTFEVLRHVAPCAVR